MRKNRRNGITGLLVIALLSFSGGPALAADKTPQTPELAAKREVVRKQQRQRITNQQRKTAAEALKAERLKIHNAKHGVQQPSPDTTGKQ
jgi:hypothetical protein